MGEEKILRNLEFEKSLRHWTLVQEFNARLAKKTEELVPKTEADKRR